MNKMEEKWNKEKLVLKCWADAIVNRFFTIYTRLNADDGGSERSE